MCHAAHTARAVRGAGQVSSAADAHPHNQPFFDVTPHAMCRCLSCHSGMPVLCHSLAPGRPLLPCRHDLPCRSSRARPARSLYTVLGHSSTRSAHDRVPASAPHCHGRYFPCCQKVGISPLSPLKSPRQCCTQQCVACPAVPSSRCKTRRTEGLQQPQQLRSPSTPPHSSAARMCRALLQPHRRPLPSLHQLCVLQRRAHMTYHGPRVPQQPQHPQ
jgi:hypothetical protein